MRTQQIESPARINLVIACGRENCSQHGDHPHERWISVDQSPSHNPDIVKSYQDLTPDDFIPFGGALFNVIYFESIGDSLEFSYLIQFLAEDGCIIHNSGGIEILLNAARRAKLNIEQFISCGDSSIIFRKRSNVDNILKLVSEDLPDGAWSPKLRILADQTEKILQEHPNLHSLLASTLAHVQLYFLNRKHRTWRNYFKDKEYDTVLQEITNDFYDYQDRVISTNGFLKKILIYKKRLPSSSTPAYKLPYDPFSKIIDICKEGILLYEVQAQPSLFNLADKITLFADFLKEIHKSGMSQKSRKSSKGLLILECIEALSTRSSIMIPNEEALREFMGNALALCLQRDRNQITLFWTTSSGSAAVKLINKLEYRPLANLIIITTEPIRYLDLIKFIFLKNPTFLDANAAQWFYQFSPPVRAIVAEPVMSSALSSSPRRA